MRRGAKIHVFKFRGKWVAAGYMFWTVALNWRSALNVALSEAASRGYGKK